MDLLPQEPDYVRDLLSRITPIILLEVMKTPVPPQGVGRVGDSVLDTLLLFAYGALSGAGIKPEDFVQRVHESAVRVSTRIQHELAHS